MEQHDSPQSNSSHEHYWGNHGRALEEVWRQLAHRGRDKRPPAVFVLSTQFAVQSVKGPKYNNTDYDKFVWGHRRGRQQRERRLLSGFC